MKNALFLFVVLTGTIVLADPPKAVISGPTEGLPGDFIDLDGSESIGDFFDWKIDPPQFSDGRKTMRFPKRDDGTLPPPQKSKQASVASRAGRYHITLTVSNAEGIASKEWDVVIFPGPPTGTAPDKPVVVVPTNPAPPVGPATPNPPTNPTPPTPAGITETMMAWVLDNLGVVQADPLKSQTKLSLAQKYRMWAKVGAKSEDPDEYAKTQALLIHAALMKTDNGEAWNVFGQLLEKKLLSLHLDTIQKNVDASIGIANGLEK